MDQRTYGSLVRHELGSSYSALDGVPFKIGRAFRRPEQYNFETEEAVLAWAKARDEAVKKAADEQAERLKQKERQKVEAAEAEASKNEISTDSPAGYPEPEEISVYDIPRYSVSLSKNNNGQSKPPLPPKVSGSSSKAVPEPGTVLTPIPIKPSVTSSIDKESLSTAKTSSKNDSQFDLAMFEAEADPFDNLELQTLNDMEELKVLLNTNTVKTNAEVSSAAEDSILSNGTFIDTPVEKTISEVGEFNLNESNVENNSFQKPRDQEVTSNSQESPIQSCDDGEYVEITRKYKKDTDDSQNVQGITPADKSTLLNGVAFYKPSSALSAALPASSKNTQIYKPVLPPIAKSALVTDNTTHQIVPSQQPLSTELGNLSSDTVPAQPWTPLSQSPREVGKLIKHTNGREFTSPSPPLSAPPIKPGRPAPPPPVGAKPRLKTKPNIQSSDVMSHSTGPSLAMFLGTTEQSEEGSSGFQSPYSRHCISTSDLKTSSATYTGADARRNSAGITPQPWNRHVPLPPALSTSTYKPSCLPPAQSLGLSDPYSSLSKEEQTFTDILTNMGFLRPRVARAVQKFGAKEKEVLDHLLAVDKLGEQSYAPVMVESALFTFENDLEKAEKFLQLHAQFEELGFQHDKIRDALVSTDLQHEKALDILTA
ncbi:ubiquitin-associated protein 1 [Plakobranchus ocellatus]|uniref:Ubiquitin-associated protein 1 n=1 Tax=Plakobranchus ocellatus TaxID=259542 RepID=A0AAV4B3D2_9GAST|nr:ubiquitin-associated protein 1 [Plakobranchus ocellatus]